MRRILPPIAALLAVSTLLMGPAKAADDTETRLRDALRSAITQTRALEDERAQLLAKNAENERIIQALKAQVDSGAVKPAQATPDRAILERMEVEFNRRLAAQHETLSKAAETLEKWKAAYQEAANMARAKAAEAAQLAGQNTALAQRAEACDAKNMALYKVGSEILDKYAAMDVADALAAKEPFLGFKRVELQNLVQDYQDKLLDQKMPAQKVSAQRAVP